MPDYHTDPAFAHTMLALKDSIHFAAVGVGWNDNGSLQSHTHPLSIPWDHAAEEAQDAGGYFLVLKIDYPKVVLCGALGEIVFPPGYYVYAGSARRGLEARLSRHNRKRKRDHWHIDALTKAVDWMLPIPIRTQQPIELQLVQTLEQIATPGPPGFGASDSPRATHIFRFEDNPLRDRHFVDALLRFRMRPPG
jgi:sugar fermentation stimulation protein A